MRWGAGCGGGAARGGACGVGGGGAVGAIRFGCAGAGGFCGAVLYGICCRACVGAVFSLVCVAARGVASRLLLGCCPRLHGFCNGWRRQRRADHGSARDHAEQVVKGRFIAEPLVERAIGSEGSSRPALRTYFVGVYFTGTPGNISELSGACCGGGGGEGPL